MIVKVTIDFLVKATDENSAKEYMKRFLKNDVRGNEILRNVSFVREETEVFHL